MIHFFEFCLYESNGYLRRSYSVRFDEQFSIPRLVLLQDHLIQPIGYRIIFNKFLLRSDCFVVKVPGFNVRIFFE